MLISKSFIGRRIFKTSLRMIHYDESANCYIPEGLDDLVNHQMKQKPVYTCIYFHAKWNPMCAKIEDQYKEMCRKNPSWSHYKVDSDLHPKIKTYYSIKAEPTFQVLLNGSHVKKIVGYNFNHINRIFRQTMDGHLKNDYFGSSGDHYVGYMKEILIEEKERQFSRDPTSCGLVEENQ